MAEEVKLFKTWSSPFGLRIVWALKLKGIQYESIDEELTNKSPLLLQYNPVYKKIPVLLHNGQPIVESLIILEYIDETWKKNPLLPEDPHKRATARFLAKFGDDKVNFPGAAFVYNASYDHKLSEHIMFSISGHVLNLGNINQGKEQEEASVQAIGNLKFLEEELKGKRFFGGEEIGFLDIALGWLANLVPVLEEILGYEVIDKAGFPFLSEWMLEFSSVPEIKENLPLHDKLVTKFRAYLAAAPDK